MGYKLIGGAPEEVSARYQEGSPAELLPLGVKQVLIHGESDELAPRKLAVEYAARARRSGDDVKLISEAGVGHFELVAPSTAAGKRVQRAVIDVAR